MKPLLFILLAFGMRAQSFKEFSTKYNAEVHFYTAFAVNEVSYQSLTLACPKWKPSRKILVSNAVTLSCIFAKELYDSRKAKPTGFSWDDVFVGTWSIPIYDIVRICANDFRKSKQSIKLEP